MKCIENSTDEVYELACKFDCEKLDELSDTLGDQVRVLDIHLESKNSYAKFIVCFTEEEIVLKNGNYLLRSQKTVPCTIPPLHYYKSVSGEELSKNFRPLSVTE